MIGILAIGYVVTILGAVSFCFLAYSSYQRGEVPGILAFCAFLLILGVGGIVGVALHLQFGGIPVDDPTVGELPLWSVLGIFPLVLGTFAWFVFAVQYTGQGSWFTRLRIGGLAVPVLGVVPLIVLAVRGDPAEAIAAQLPATLAVIYALALFFVGTFLILRTTYRYGHLSVVQGVCLSAPPLLLFLAMNSPGLIIMEGGHAAATIVYGMSYVVSASAITVAVVGYDTFESTPAVGELGERAIAREIDDLIFVCDHRDRIITVNDTAVTTLGTNRTDLLDASFESVIGVPLSALEEMDTVEVRTPIGQRKLDVQTSALGDQHEHRLGMIVSLRDVTERELRQERLTVLNRVLRHNHRNQIDVIRANAEAILEEDDPTRATAILESAEKLGELSQDAREIDRFLSRPTSPEPIDLHETIRRLVDEHDWKSMDVSVWVSDEASLYADPEAVALIFENAIAYARQNARMTIDIDVTAMNGTTRIRVSHDGESIPAGEREALESGTELPLRHGRGLGLWLIKWGVTKLNGTVDFDLEELSGIRIDLPKGQGTES